MDFLVAKDLFGYLIITKEENFLQKIWLDHFYDKLIFKNTKAKKLLFSYRNMVCSTILKK